MSGHRPLTRSRSKKFKETNNVPGGLDPKFLPSPLAIRKLSAGGQAHVHQLEVAAIGVAVADPGETALPPLPPKPVGWGGQFHYSMPTNRQAPVPMVAAGEKRESKTKGHRWRALGSLFGRKDSAPRVETVKPNVLTTGSSKYQLGAAQTSQPSRKRAGSDKEKAMEKSRGREAQINRRPSLGRRASSRRRPVGGKRRPSQPRVDRHGSSRNSIVLATTAGMVRTGLRQGSGSRPLPDFSLMKVEIPHAEMERYSIMFSHALGSGANNSQTSLARPRKLEDTQQMTRPESGRKNSDASFGASGSLDIGPHEGLALAKSGQRERSGSVSSKAPSFSLFPTTSANGRGNSPARGLASRALPKPSPLGRSVTAPNVNNMPRPALKPAQSDFPVQPVPLTADACKENMPVSRWNKTHSRHGSRASSSGDRPPSRGHVSQLSMDSNPSTFRARHNRNSSLEPAFAAHQHSYSLPGSNQPLGPVGGLSSNLALSETATSAMFKPSQPPANTSNAAFPARKSSLKRVGPRRPRQSLTPSPPPPSIPSSIASAPAPAPAPAIAPPNPLRAHPSISDLNSPSAPLLATANHTPTSTSTQAPTNTTTTSAPPSETAADPPPHNVINTTVPINSPPPHVSVARQISITRRQRQQLVPVMVAAKTARQPVQPLLVFQGDEAARVKSVVGGLECETPVTAGPATGEPWNEMPPIRGYMRRGDDMI